MVDVGDKNPKGSWNVDLSMSLCSSMISYPAYETSVIEMEGILLSVLIRI